MKRLREGSAKGFLDNTRSPGIKGFSLKKEVSYTYFYWPHKD